MASKKVLERRRQIADHESTFEENSMRDFLVTNLVKTFFLGGRKPTHLTSIFSLWTSVLTSAKAVSVVPSGSDKTDVHGC